VAFALICYIPPSGILVNPGGAGEEKSGMDAETKKKATHRLRRIAGQVEGIQRMLEQDRYCVDVLLQVAAVRAALDKVGKVILGAHVETCVAAAFASGKRREREQKMEELMEVFTRFGALSGR
jgi:DNA-binding FrmR family transcriptional regulator